MVNVGWNNEDLEHPTLTISHTAGGRFSPIPRFGVGGHEIHTERRP